MLLEFICKFSLKVFWPFPSLVRAKLTYTFARYCEVHGGISRLETGHSFMKRSFLKARIAFHGMVGSMPSELLLGHLPLGGFLVINILPAHFQPRDQNTIPRVNKEKLHWKIVEISPDDFKRISIEEKYFPRKYKKGREQKLRSLW